MDSSQAPDAGLADSLRRPRERSVFAAGICIFGVLLFGGVPLLRLLALPTWVNSVLIVVVCLGVLEVLSRALGRRYPDDPRFGRFFKDWLDAGRFAYYWGVLWGMRMVMVHLPLPVWAVIPLAFIAALSAMLLFLRALGRRYPDDPRFGVSFAVLAHRGVRRRHPDDPR